MRSKIALFRIGLPFLCLTATGMVPGWAAPIYSLETTIPVPASPANVQPGGAFTSFDISFFDPTTQLDYVADRSNAAVDIFSARTNSFVGRIGGSGGLFTGQQSSPDLSGPDGVLVAIASAPDQHQLWAGNGNSTLLGFNINNNYTALPNVPLATGPASDKRVDEMAFAPANHLLLVANDAATPSPYMTLIDTTSNAAVKRITFDGMLGTPNATNGIEQSVWDPNTKRFYVSVPQVNGTGPGAIAQIDTAGTVTHIFDLASFGIGTCSPAGLARGAGSQLMVGCSNASQSILFDPTQNGGKGGLIKTFSQISGSDEVWYDPTRGLFFVTGANNPGGPVLGIIDGNTDTFLQNLSTTPGNDHSVAVDPISGEAFVPFAGGADNTVCPLGCIGVFAPEAAVPEPASLPLILPALAMLGGIVMRRRSRS